MDTHIDEYTLTYLYINIQKLALICKSGLFTNSMEHIY